MVDNLRATSELVEVPAKTQKVQTLKDGTVVYTRKNGFKILLIQPLVKHLDYITQHFGDLEGNDLNKSMRAIRSLLLVLCMVQEPKKVDGKKVIYQLTEDYLNELPLDEFGTLFTLLKDKLSFFRPEEGE